MISKQNEKTTSRKFTLRGTPWWAWNFVILSIAIPIISLGGAIPAVLAIISSMLNIKITQSNIKLSLKLLSCCGITAVAWALFGVLELAMSYI